MKRYGVGAVGCVVAAMLSACGSQDTTGGGEVIDVVESLFPLAEGNSWTYRVTVDSVTSTKETTVGAEEAVGGDGPHADKTAFKITTMKRDGTDKTESWQATVGERVLRYRELSYSAASGQVALDETWDPYKLHVDWTEEHTTAGATWLEIYDEIKTPTGGTATTAEARDSWSVDEVGATVSVPAGDFDDAIVLTKAGGTSMKTYWYVPGVGKVKETGGQTEELIEWVVAE